MSAGMSRVWGLGFAQTYSRQPLYNGKVRKVITYGTFDLLHVGHIHLLRRARELGDHLTVGLSTDQFNTVKHKSSLLRYEERKVILESVRYVDAVISEDMWEQKERDIQELAIDVLVMGSDWAGAFDHLKILCEVVYLPRTADISTAALKKRITSETM